MANIKIQFTSVGGQAVEAQFQSIIKGATATSREIVALSQALNTSAKGAATFASNIGLSVGQVNQVTNSFKSLRSSGLSLSETFKILQNETGINASQYKALVTQLKSAETQTDAYVQSLRDQEKAQEATADASAAQILALQQVNQAAQQVSQALNAFTGKAVGAFIEYEDALTTLRAKANPTTEQMKALEAAILDVALVTTQTPASAAKAATSFISLGAGADGAAQNLKTAAQLTDAFRGDFTVASKVVQLGATIFSDFGETAQSVGDKISYISDTSAVGSTNGLDEFLQLFSKSAPLAKTLGINLDELIASFAVLRDAGQAPEVAATSLKSLLSTVIDNKQKFSELGIEVFDANGKFIGLQQTFQKIAEVGSATSASVSLTNSELAELSEQATKSGLSIEQVNDIFGKIGVSSALTLAGSYEKVAEKTAAVSNQMGTLAEKSAVINSSIQGQINLLTGSFESALVDLGKSLSGVTAPAVAGMLELINVFLSAPPAIKNFVGVTLGVTTAAAGVVAALTGFGLALKALEVAQVGTTLKTIAATGANTANAVSAVAAGVANQGLARSLGIVAVAGINAAQGITAAAVSAGKTALAFAPLLLALGGVVASAKLVQSSIDSSTSANRAKGAIEGLNKAIEDYNNVTGQELIPKAEKTKSKFEELGGGLKELGKELIFRAENFKAFGIGTSAAEAGANSLTIATADLQPSLSALTNEFLRLKQNGELSGESAQKSLIPALEAAKLAIAALQAEGAKNINTTAAQTDQWRIEQERLTDLIEEIKGAAVATTGLDVATKEAIVTYQELADALANTTGTIETDLLNAQRDAYAELGDNKVALENRLFELEQDSLEKRLEAQKKFLADLSTATFENESEKEAKIGEAKQSIAELELQIAKETSDRLIEQEEETQKLQEEIAKKLAEKQEALAKQVYDRKKILLDQETADREAAIVSQVASQEAAIESLNDQSEALTSQLSLLELIEQQNALISQGRIAAYDQEIADLTTAKGLLDLLVSADASREEKALALNELRRLGIDTDTTGLDISSRIVELEGLKRTESEKRLLQQQAFERSQLAFQQELERLENDRAVRQAKINAIEAARGVIQAEQLVKSQQIEASEQRRLLNLGKINGASEAELINLQSQLDATNAQIGLSVQSIELAKQAAILSQAEVGDAERLRNYFEKIAEQQTTNLTITQQQAREQLRNTNEAAATKAQFDLAGESATRVTGAIEGATKAASGLTSEVAKTVREAGLLEKSLVAAGKELTDLQKQQLSEPLRNQSFDSSGKNTTLAKREVPGVGTQYFVGGKEVSEQEYNEARQAQEGSKKESKITRQTISGVGAPAGVGSIVGDGELALSTSEEILSQIQNALKEQTEGSKQALSAAKQVYNAATKLNPNIDPGTINPLVQAKRGETLIQRQQEQWLEELKEIEAQRSLKAGTAEAEQEYAEALRELATEIRSNAVTVSSKLIASGFATLADVRVGIPGRASGGSVAAFQPYIVGEKGRELFIPSQPGTIVPNNRLVAPTLPGSYSPTIAGGNGFDVGKLLTEIRGLRSDIASRPIPTINAPATFINERDPIQARIALLQGQLKAGRAIV